MHIEDVLAPMSVTTFINEYLGQCYFRTEGIQQRFVNLLTWQQLNDVLSHLRVSGPRVSLVMNGRPVPEREYLCHTGRTVGSQLQSGAVMEKLRQGATLVVNGIDELVPAVQKLVESFERLLRIHVGANLYAGWRHQRGFDLHWDNHDTFILQVSGRKHWRIYTPTRLHPVLEDSEIGPTPDVVPIWDGLLQEGDVLYMPRGWWHIATPIDEPSLHLTLGLTRRTGIDLLNWVVGRLTTHTGARADVPFLAGAEEQNAYISNLRNAVTETLAATTLDDFMAWTEAGIPPRPHFSLPSLDASLLTMKAATRLKLTGVRRLWLQQREPGVISFDVLGNRWTCADALQPALRLLSARDARRVDELTSVVPSNAVPRLRMLLLELAAGRVVSCEDEIATVDDVQEHAHRVR